MDYKTLNCIYLINENKSISQAAIAMGISRQNLTTKLKELECTLGFKLFTRSNNGVILTPKGEEFITNAKPIIESFQNILLDCKGVKDYYIASTYNPYCMECIYTYFPTLDINMSNIRYLNLSSEDIIYGVIDDSIDLGILGVTDSEYKYLKEKYDFENLEVKTIAESNLCIQVMSSSPLYNKESVQPTDLKKLTYIKLKYLFNKNQYDYNRELKSIKLNTTLPSIYVNNSQEILLLLQNENRFSTSSYINKYHLQKHGVKCIPFNGPQIKITHLAIYKNNTNNMTRNFSNILSNYIQDMAKEE